MYDVEVLGDRLLLNLSVRGTEGARERGGAAFRFQVLTIRSSKVVMLSGLTSTEALYYFS